MKYILIVFEINVKQSTQPAELESTVCTNSYILNFTMMTISPTLLSYLHYSTFTQKC